MQLQPTKRRFRSSRVRYYGHVLNGTGVKVDEDYLRATSEMKRPESQEEVRRFLGLAAYVAKFIPGHSQVAAPLRELLRDDMV